MTNPEGLLFTASVLEVVAIYGTEDEIKDLSRAIGKAFGNNETIDGIYKKYESQIEHSGNLKVKAYCLAKAVLKRRDDISRN